MLFFTPNHADAPSPQLVEGIARGGRDALSFRPMPLRFAVLLLTASLISASCSAAHKTGRAAKGAAKETGKIGKRAGQKIHNPFK
jgi:hypothetical protein